MSLKDLFMPDKKKVIFAVILSVVFFILVLTFFNTGFYGKFTNTDFTGKIFSVLTNLIFGLVLYYPLSCGVLFIFNRFFDKQKTKSKTSDLVVAVLVILIFNPFVLGFLYQSTIYVNNNIINTPCGLEIIEFSEISPTRDAGMNVGEIITKVDGEDVMNTEFFIHVMTLKKPGDTIRITTNASNYDVKTIQNPNRPSDAYFGMKFKDNICEK